MLNGIRVVFTVHGSGFTSQETEDHRFGETNIIEFRYQFVNVN